MRKTIAVLLAFCLMAICLAGCQKNGNPGVDRNGLADYMASVEAQSDVIKDSLENDLLTQTDMNQKSQELREIWDAALNHLLEEAKKALPDAEMDALTAEQNAWRESRDEALEAVGKEFEGGSMYALIVNSEAAALTEARVYELYEMLK